MGSLAVIGQGVSDVVSGQVSSQEAYMSVGFWSAVAGAVSGMVGSGVSKFLTSKAKMLTPMAVNGLSGMVETVAENAVLGIGTKPGDLGLAFGLSSFLPGIGDNLARGAKRLIGQADNLVRGIKGITRQLDNLLRGASRQADEALEAALKQTNEAMEDVAKQTDDILEIAGKQMGYVPPKTPDEDMPDVQSGGRKQPVIYGSEDIGKYQYNMIENPGPLVDIADNPAKNFYGGRYNVEVLTEDRIYYRGGNSKSPLGQWFTTEAPESVAKVRIDTAVKPQWIDPATGELLGESVIDTVYTIKIPKGTTVYTGPVGSQGGVYCGGYDIMQTFIETPWKIEGIKVISKTILE